VERTGLTFGFATAARCRSRSSFVIVGAGRSRGGCRRLGLGLPGSRGAGTPPKSNFVAAMCGSTGHRAPGITDEYHFS
jgi:hypothetical protein